MALDTVPIRCETTLDSAFTATKLPPAHCFCGRVWIRLVCPLLIVFIEVGILTPFVEIPDGPLARLANHHVCAGLLFALVVMVVFASGEARPLALPVVGRPAWHSVLWLAVHLLFFLLFFRFSVALTHGLAVAVNPWAPAFAWSMLAAGVGVSNLFAFCSPRMVGAWAWHHRGKAILAGLLGCTVAVAGPWLQGFWPMICRPALELDQKLLAWIYGEGIAGMTADRVPVLGTRRLVLLVTPGCSGVDAFLTLWLLALVFFVPCWRQLRKTFFIGGLLAGTCFLYVLNALRLFGLVMVGLAFSPQVCVGVAHSQITGIAFIAVDIVFLAGLRWCCIRPAVCVPVPATPESEL